MMKTMALILAILAATVQAQMVGPGSVGVIGRGPTLKSGNYLAPSGGPNTYYYSQTQGSGTPGTLFSQIAYMQFAKVTVGAAGTATSIAVYETFGGTGNIKIGLYDSGRNQIAVSGAVAVVGPTWCTATISVSVTAADYYIAWISEGATMGFEMDTAGTNEGRTDGSESPTYAAGPPATLGANNNPPGGRPTIRVFVQ